MKAGTDLDCGDFYPKHLQEALNDGATSEEMINQALTHLFKVQFRLVLYDPPERVPYSSIGRESIASKDHLELSLEAAIRRCCHKFSENLINEIKILLRSGDTGALM